MASPKQRPKPTLTRGEAAEAFALIAADIAREATELATAAGQALRGDESTRDARQRVVDDAYERLCGALAAIRPVHHAQLLHETIATARRSVVRGVERADGWISDEDLTASAALHTLASEAPGLAGRIANDPEAARLFHQVIAVKAERGREGAATIEASLAERLGLLRAPTDWHKETTIDRYRHARKNKRK